MAEKGTLGEKKKNKMELNRYQVGGGGGRRGASVKLKERSKQKFKTCKKKTR